MTARGPIEVHIDELVLTGFDAGAGELVGQALRLELTRLVTAGGGWPSDAGREHALVRADAPALKPGATPETSGQEIARAILGMLGA